MAHIDDGIDSGIVFNKQRAGSSAKNIMADLREENAILRKNIERYSLQATEIAQLREIIKALKLNIKPTLTDRLISWMQSYVRSR